MLIAGIPFRYSLWLMFVPGADRYGIYPYFTIFWSSVIIESIPGFLKMHRRVTDEAYLAETSYSDQ